MEYRSNVLIKVKDLCKSYGEGDSRVMALDHVSLEFGRGQLTAVLGNSGSGKSTLLNMLGGMDSFDSGSIIVDGKDLGKMNDKALTAYRRDTVGFIFQSFNLIAGLTAKENVELTAVRGKPGIALQALNIVGLAGRENRYPSQLSGGQQQRVSIARALAKDPELLLCDEPTGALDTVTGKTVLECLVDLVHNYGKTMILVTHNQDIAKTADRIIRMKNGMIIDDRINENKLSVQEIEW